MDKKLIDYIQTEVTSLAKQKYPNNERLQWIYVHGFICAQLAVAYKNDSSVLYRFKAAIKEAKSKE
jgi:hypothetical protein